MCRYNMTIRALLRSSPDVNINYIMINIISALPIWQKQLWRQNRTKATARIDFTIYYLATKTVGNLTTIFCSAIEEDFKNRRLNFLENFGEVNNDVDPVEQDFNLKEVIIWLKLLKVKEGNNSVYELLKELFLKFKLIKNE